MGIDIYLRWPNMSEADKEKQLCGFNIDKGNVGYLREAYHGGPYYTKFFVEEAFESSDGEAEIPAEVLELRVDEAIRINTERHKKVYKADIHPDHPTNQSIRDFAALARKLEDTTGERCVIEASY